MKGYALWAQFKRKLGLCFFAGLLAVPVVNIVADPYEVFGTGVLPFSSTSANMRYLKLEQLEERPLDLLLIGSSVTQMIDPRWIVPGKESVFNLASFSVDTAALELMAREGVRHVKPGGNVVIGIDPALFLAVGDRGLAFKLPPEVSGVDRREWWKDYILAPSLQAVAYKVFGYFGPVNIEFDMEYGHYRLLKWDAEMEREPLSYQKKKFNTKEVAKMGPFIEDPVGISRIERLAAVLEDSEVVVTWVLMPVHPLMRAHIGEDHLFRLYDAVALAVSKARKPARVVDLRDHFITRDDGFWYEHRHFAPAGAKMVAAEIRSAMESRVLGALLDEKR